MDSDPKDELLEEIATKKEAGEDRPAEPTEKEKELLKDARQSKKEQERKQEEALEAIAEGENLEEFETVKLGKAEMEVKAWLPGDVEDTVLQAQQLAESEDPAQIKRSKETMLSALAEMTTDSAYGMDFWRKYQSKWGWEGLILAVETILEPASNRLEERREGAESFRSDEQRDGFRAGMSDDRLPPEGDT